jgi:hypothetical protein
MVMPDGRLRHSVYFGMMARKWSSVKTHLERLPSSQRGEGGQEDLA